MQYPVRYIRVKKFAELTGYTEKAVYGKIDKGVWLEGVHFLHAPDGNICINLEEYDRRIGSGKYSKNRFSHPDQALELV